jgi:hypothetical protein
VPVLDHANLRRDVKSNAIVDVDSDAYERYLRDREAKIGQRSRITQLEERINKIDTDVSDIKNLLTQLLERS